MTLLWKALPDLVVDLESALIRIGRGDLADQLREVELERWTYDEFADVGYLYLKSPKEPNVVDRHVFGAKHAETLCPSDDLAINLQVDNHRRLERIELFDARAIFSRLE